MLDEGEGASDEVQQWALLHEDALGPRWHSRRRLPRAPRFQDGDVVELDSVQLFPSSHDWPEMKVSTRYFHRIRYESVPTRSPWGLPIPAGMVAWWIINVEEGATLGLCEAGPSLFGRNTRIAFHLRPFHIFAILYLYTCRRAHLSV